MQIIKIILSYVFLVVVSLFLLSSSATGEFSLPPTAELLPPDTIAVVNISNFSRLQEQFKKTGFHKFYKDPSMADFVNAAKSKCLEEIKKENNSILRAIVESKIYPEGRMAFAFILKSEGKEMEESFIIISQWGSGTGDIKRAVRESSEKAVSAGSHRKSEEYRGVNIVTLIQELPSREVPDYSNYDPSQSNKPPMKTYQPEPQEIHYCFVEDCLIASNDMESVRFVIAHIQGASSPDLSMESDYNNMLKAVGPYHEVDFYVNIQQLIKVNVAGENSEKSKTIVSKLGLDSIRSFACSVGVGRHKRSSLNGKALLKSGGSKKGILKVLDFESSGLNLPRFLSASTSSVTVINLDIPKAFEEVASIAGSISPQAGVVFYAPLVPGGPGGEGDIQLQRDVISHLGSRIIITNELKEGNGEGSDFESQSYFLVSVEDRDSLEKSLSELHEKLLARGKKDSKRELLGHTIYLLEAGGFFPWLLQGGLRPMQGVSEQKRRERLSMAFTVTDTHLIFGKESAVENAIRAISSRQMESLKTARWFATARDAIPAAVGFASLKNREATSRILWEQMKKAASSKEKSVQTGAGFSNRNFFFLTLQGEMFDYSLLPAFDEVSKYFGLSAFYGKSRADGLYIEFKYFNPPGIE